MIIPTPKANLSFNQCKIIIFSDGTGGYSEPLYTLTDFSGLDIAKVGGIARRTRMPFQASGRSLRRVKYVMCGTKGRATLCDSGMAVFLLSLRKYVDTIPQLPISFGAQAGPGGLPLGPLSSLYGH